MPENSGTGRSTPPKNAGFSPENSGTGRSTPPENAGFPPENSVLGKWVPTKFPVYGVYSCWKIQMGAGKFGYRKGNHRRKFQVTLDNNGLIMQFCGPRGIIFFCCMYESSLRHPVCVTENRVQPCNSVVNILCQKFVQFYSNFKIGTYAAG